VALEGRRSTGTFAFMLRDGEVTFWWVTFLGLIK